ncbi:MAG: hypothetical protein AAGG09_06450 [Pseudomonadota bacterium]
MAALGAAEQEELSWAREALADPAPPDATLRRACRIVIARTDSPREAARANDLLHLIEGED